MSKTPTIEFRSIVNQNGTKHLEYRQLMFECKVNTKDGTVQYLNIEFPEWSEWKRFPSIG